MAKNSNGMNGMQSYIKDLEKAIKLMSEMVKLQTDADKMASFYGDHMAEISKLMEKISKHNATINYNGGSNHKQVLDSLKEEKALMETKLKNQAELIAQQEILIDNAKEQLKQEKEKLKIKEDIKKQRTESYKQLEKFKTNQTKSTTPTRVSLNNLGDFIVSNNRQKYQQETFNKIYDEEMKKVKRSRGKIDVNQVEETINERYAEEINKSSAKFQLGADLIQVAANTFKKGVEVFTNLFKSGISNQSNAYENTFSNISVRTGITRNQYLNRQLSTASDLKSQGLFDNVAVSEVQEMWNSLANTGMNDGDIVANAIDNVVTQKIVPYLDTTSQSLNLLNNRFDGKFLKDIRGINEANLELAGNNYATQDILNQLLDEVAPMSDEALQNLAQGSTELTAMANKLMAAGATKSQANEAIATLYKQQKYSNQIMRSGSLYEKQALISNLNTNIYDPENYNDAIGNNLDVAIKMSNYSPGYTSTSNGIVTNVNNDAIGLSNNLYNLAEKLKEKDLTGSGLAESTNLTQEELQKLAEQATEDLKSGKNQTQKTLQETTVENLATGLAVGKEWMGHWTDLIVTAIEGVKTAVLAFLGTKIVEGVIGKSLGALAGSAGGGVGAGLLATGGGILLGLGAANIIKEAIQGAFDNEDDSNTSAEEKQLEGTSLEGNKAAAVLGGMATTDQKENNNFGSRLGSAWNTTTRWIGVGTLGWTRDTAQINKDDLGFFREKIRTLGGGPTKDAASDALLVWTLLLASAGRLTDIDAFKDITNDDLKQMVEESGVAPSSWDKYLNDTVKSIGYLPNKNEKEDQTTIDWDKLGINYHRQGLDEVPYDNYPAMLHEGEAVLTASTADELRNLVVEYRESETQNIKFDTIISDQTNALVQKMSEIIEVIQSQNNYSTSSSSWSEAVKTSMRNLVSTKSF